MAILDGRARKVRRADIYAWDAVGRGAALAAHRVGAYTRFVTEPSSSSAMKIQAWQIWHVFSTYLPKPIENIHQAAVDLVEAAVVECAMLGDGITIWRDGASIHVDETTVTPSERGTRATITFPSETRPPDFALEALYTSGYLRFGELQAFGDEGPVPYVRALLGECRLENDDRITTFYPVLKLYETGVLLLELRVFSPPGETAVERLVRDYVNVFQVTFARAHVPAAVAALAPAAQADWAHARPWTRAALLWLNRRHRMAVEERTDLDDEGPFEYSSCELPSDGSGETLATVALTTASVIAYVVSRPRTGLALIARGQRPILSIGSWSSRPHVYLLKFSDQQTSAAANEERHRAAFGAILGRVTDIADGERFMETTLRPFDDYGIYMNRAVRLWVGTPDKLEAPADLTGDPNYGHVVYLHQPVAELLEYSYALHTRLAETARDPLSDPREIARLRVQLAELPTLIDRHVHAGEMRDLLAEGYRQMGIPELREEIAALLDAKNDLATYEENARSATWSTLLTIVFGLVAVPSVATDILTPAWKAFGWWKPADADYRKVFFIGIAVAAVTISLIAVRALLMRRRT